MENFRKPEVSSLQAEGITVDQFMDVWDGDDDAHMNVMLKMAAFIYRNRAVYDAPVLQALICSMIELTDKAAVYTAFDLGVFYHSDQALEASSAEQ